MTKSLGKGPGKSPPSVCVVLVVVVRAAGRASEGRRLSLTFTASGAAPGSQPSVGQCTLHQPHTGHQDTTCTLQLDSVFLQQDEDLWLQGLLT